MEGGFYAEIRAMQRFLMAFFVLLGLWCRGALADLASVGYVNEIVDALKIQSDWAQSDPAALDYIKNKPQIPSVDAVEYVANKVSQISASATDSQYPSAAAVRSALATKADTDDVRFNTISTTAPTGTPPAGQVFIWFN